jgi:hypothetical protein
MIHEEGTLVDSPDGERPISLERGPNYHLVIPGKKVLIDLSFMTHEELVAARTFWNMAFDLAEPVVLLRDKEAQDAFDSGDDSFHRLHRPVPKLVVRPGAQRAHSEVLRVGLAHVVERGWAFFRSHLGAGGDGDAVADQQAQGAGTPDDPASPDEPADVR